MAGGLPQTGVELIAKGRDAFLGAMKNASKAVDAFSGSTKEAEKKTSMFGDVLKGTLAANAIMSGFQAITGQITNLGNQAFTAATQMQELTVSLESLAAREIMGAGGATDMTDALKKAEPVAQNLLERIKEISLESPFEYQDIVNVFRLNMAFGQTSEMSLELTRAILNMSAASGQGAGMMERIAYNFSQMSLTGRITQRDIRDLALAGVDVSKVLRDELGMSVAEVDSKLKSGAMTFEEVSKAFVRYADKNFGGAAERMSRTFSGLQSSFNDLITFSGLDIFGPALERVTTALQGLFATAQTVVSSGVLKDIGTILGELVGMFITDVPKASNEVEQGMLRIKEAVEQTTPEAAKALEEIINENQQMEIRTKFQNMAIEALEWGANIATNLAEGIIMGASAVLSALLWLGNMIASWLQPGSPPKILPDLPEWGAKAMNEYLKGFSNADFGYMNAVTSPIEQALSMMGKGNLIPAFKLELAKMFSKGSLDPSFAASLVEQTGVFGKELLKLTQQQLQLASATERVAMAEKAVDDARKQEVKAFGVVNDEIAAYNKMLRAGAPEEALKYQKQRVDESVKSFRSARKERSEAEKNLDVAKEALAIMQEQVATQKQLVAEMLEYAKAVLAAQQQEEEEKKKKEAGGGKDAAGIPLPKIGMPAAGSAEDPFQGIADAFKARVAAIFEQMKTDIGTAWENSGIKAKWDEITGLFNFDNIFTDEQVGQIFKFAGAAIVLGGVLAFLLSPTGLLIAALTLLGVAFVAGKPGLDNFVAGISFLPGIMENLKKRSDDAAFSIGITMGGALINFLPKAIKFKDELQKNVIASTVSLKKKIIELAEKWDEKWKNMDENVKAFILSFVTGITESITGEEGIVATVTTTITELPEKIKEVVPDFLEAGSALIQGLIDGTIGDQQAFIDAVVGIAQNAIAAMLAALGSHSPSKVFAAIGETIPQGLREGVAKESQTTVSAPTKPQYIQAAANNSTREANVYMGGVNINNAMDAAGFEAYVTGIISKALGAI